MEDYKRLSKEALGKMSISVCPSVMKFLQPVREKVLTSARTIFEFKLLQSSHLGASKLLKRSTFTYLGSYAIRGHPESGS